MAWHCQATSHYLNQCWCRSTSPYGVARPKWVDSYIKDIIASTKFSVRLLGSHSYLADVTAAKLWQLSLNLYMIFNGWKKNLKIGKLMNIGNGFIKPNHETGHLICCFLVCWIMSHILHIIYMIIMTQMTYKWCIWVCKFIWMSKITSIVMVKMGMIFAGITWT